MNNNRETENKNLMKKMIDIMKKRDSGSNLDQ
jgi:hypothetical protein